MVFVGDEDETNNAYRKSRRIKRVTVLDSFSYTLGLERKWVTKH